MSGQDKQAIGGAAASYGAGDPTGLNMAQFTNFGGYGVPIQQAMGVQQMSPQAQLLQQYQMQHMMAHGYQVPVQNPYTPLTSLNMPPSATAIANAHAQAMGYQQMTPPPAPVPEHTWDEWMAKLDDQVVNVIKELIEAQHLSEGRLDNGCLDELCRTDPATAASTLTTFRSVLEGPNSRPISNPSAYITRMLKNPNQGAGGRGRGGRGRGRGRGRSKPDPAQAAENIEKLKEALGDKFQDLDDCALNIGKRATKGAVEHCCDEWALQKDNVNKTAAWVSKILLTHAERAKAQ